MRLPSVCWVTFREDVGRGGGDHSLALSSASLLISVFDNSGANTELQISSGEGGKKNLISRPPSQAPCQSLGRCVNASPSPRTPRNTEHVRGLWGGGALEHKDFDSN